jgi:predicted ATPase with chaperone activity
VLAALDAKAAALRDLGCMIGLDSVKKQISRLCDVVIYNEIVRGNGLEPTAANHHMLFLGNPGTGKTTVAKIVSKMLNQIGIVPKDTVKVYDNARTALVDGVVGGTALKSERVFKSAQGGVLFLDEARHFDLHAAHLHACCAIPNPNPTLHRRTLSFPCKEAATSHWKQSESCFRNPRSAMPTRS